jgi:hypothetical protein
MEQQILHPVQSDALEPLGHARPDALEHRELGRG